MPKAAPAAFLLILFVVSGTALALDPSRAVTQYDTKTWFAKDGLPQNSVNAIRQTPDGYLWFGTEEGLARFDGAQFTTFDRNTRSLVHRYVMAVTADTSGGLWIGTLSGGLTRYGDGRFTQHGRKLGEANDGVRSLHDDGRGGLWVGTIGGGLHLVRDGHRTSYTRREGLSSDIVRAIVSDGENGVWLGTAEGLNRFRNGTIETFTTKDGIADDAVMAIHRDRRGAVWIGTLGGLTRYENGRFTSFHKADGLPHDSVYALFDDRAGNLWIGTEGGLCRFSDGKFATLTARDGLSGDRIRSIFEDREGSLWVGTFGGGLTRLQDGKFITVTTREGLAHDAVGPLLQDREGAIWIGTMGGGVTRLKDGRAVSYTTRDGLASDLIQSLAEDHTGALWIGTFGGGLSRYRDGAFTTYTQRDGLAANVVMTLAEDREGSLWIGTGGGGLNRFKDGVFTRFTTAEGLAHDVVRWLSVDREGVLWISTMGGLSRFENGRFTNFSTQNGLSLDLVGPVHQDTRGTHWIGTLGAGLLRYKNGVFTPITARDGLFDDSVYSIIEDAKGYFWMSCNHGVFRVSRKELDDFAEGRIGSVTSLAFGEADGMKSRECNGNSPAAFLAQDGRIWFATLRGAATIDPQHIPFNSVPPPVLIERVLADQHPIAMADGALVPPGKGALEFHFTAPSYQAPERVSFRYRLEGFDKDWIDAGTRRVAYYTNLPPGRYAFRVAACNNDGVWNEHGAATAIRLEPHFYQTYWFYGLSAAAVLFLGGWWHRSRVRRLKLRARALRSLVNERTQAQQALAVSHQQLEEALGNLQRAQESMVQQERLRALGQMASGVTHDFNNVLTPILGFTDLLLSHPKILEDKTKALDYLVTVHTAAQDAAHIVMRLREFYRPRDETERFPLVKLDTIVQQVILLTQPRWKDQAMGRGVSIAVRAELTETPCFPGNESDLREMLTNLIFNAVDAMPEGGTITLRTRVEGTSVVLEVIDPGTGMTDEVRRRCLEPFFTTKGEDGTGLGLPMVYGIVRRHHGTIEILSVPGKGTTFQLSFPIEPASRDTEQATIARAAPELRPLRVLVVEDEPRVLSLIQECFTADRHIVETATNGRDGLVKVRDGHFDLIVTDRSMPMMNGEQLASAAKRVSPDTPILLLTGDHMVDRNERPAGVDLVLTKPVTMNALRDAVEKLMAATEPHVAPVART